MTSNLDFGPLRRAVEEKTAPFLLGREDWDLFRPPLEPVNLQVERVRHAAADSRRVVQDSRRPESGVEFLQRREPPQNRPPLEKEHLPARLPEESGRRQAVVASPDHDDVVPHPFPFPQIALALRSSRAAFAPGAPIIPPPGWVAEPHIQRFRTGVR